MPDFSLTKTTRRTVLAMAGASLLGLGTRGVWATPAFIVPQVDRLTLQVLDDAATFGPFLDNITRPGLTVVRVGNGGQTASPRMLPRTLVGEFGLSILADSMMGDSERRVLIDFGYSRETLLTNMQLLGIDPMTIDAAVLSHGHLDHYGGYTALYGEAASNAHRIPLFVGGEEAFCERVAMIGNPPPIMGTLDRAALLNAGFDVVIRPDPAVVAGQAFTTGIIPLTSFERAAIPTRMRPGIGCDRAGLDGAKQSAIESPDDGEHELATCYAVNGLGLVVVASCSHRGVINSVRRAQAVSGIEKVHAVLGGFHLVRPRTEDEARRTVAEFALIDPTYIVPMHCTGEVFMAEALRVMPEKIIRSYVGSKFIFSNSA